MAEASKQSQQSLLSEAAVAVDADHPSTVVKVCNTTVLDRTKWRNAMQVLWGWMSSTGMRLELC